jgi:hypothetical protein
MMSGASDASGEFHLDAWIRRVGFFREVIGYADAVSLLGDTRMHAQFLEMFQCLGITSGPERELIAASLLSMNGEEHRRLRSLIAGPFTPRAVNAVRPVAREEANQLITAVESTGRCEFVTEFAVPYVQRTTSHHIGCPKNDVAMYWNAVELMASARSAEEFVGGLLALVEYAKPILQERSRHPRDDVLTLVAEKVAQGSLPETVALVLVATLPRRGTSRRSTSWGSWCHWSAAGRRSGTRLLRASWRQRGSSRRCSDSVPRTRVSYGASLNPSTIEECDSTKGR